MRRKDRQMDEGFAKELFAACTYATLATVGPEDNAYVTPVCLVLHEGRLYFHCALEGQKLDYLKEHPKVCLNCVGRVAVVPEGFTMHYESAVAQGLAAVVTDEKEKRAALAALCAKYAPGQPCGEEIARSLDRTCVCRIDVYQWSGKRNGFAR